MLPMLALLGVQAGAVVVILAGQDRRLVDKVTQEERGNLGITKMAGVAVEKAPLAETERPTQATAATG